MPRTHELKCKVKRNAGLYTGYIVYRSNGRYIYSIHADKSRADRSHALLDALWIRDNLIRGRVC